MMLMGRKMKQKLEEVSSWAVGFLSPRAQTSFCNEGEMEEAENKEGETTEELQYQDYIERSIEMLANTGLNPLLL